MFLAFWTDPTHKVVAPWQQNVGEGQVQGEVDDEEKLATSLVSYSDGFEKPAHKFKKGTTGIRNTGATGMPRHQGTRSTYAGGSALGGTAPLNRRKMTVGDTMKNLDSVPNQPKSVKPWESNISDDSEDEEGAPRSTVNLVSWADKRNLVSKRGQKDPKLNEASVYGENVVRNLNRRYIEPDDLKLKKAQRKDRDMAQAWGASLGEPRAKPIGMPAHDTTAPWDVNASDGEDNSDPEVEPVTLVSWSNSHEKPGHKFKKGTTGIRSSGAIGLPRHQGTRATYAGGTAVGGTAPLNRRRQKPEDRAKYNADQREKGKDHAWAVAHGTVPNHAKVRPPWEATVVSTHAILQLPMMYTSSLRCVIGLPLLVIDGLSMLTECLCCLER